MVADSVKNFSIDRIKNPLFTMSAPRWTVLGKDNRFYSHEYDLYEYGRMIDTESFVSIAFKKKRTLMFKRGYELSSFSESNIEYLKNRISEIEYVTETSFPQLLREVADNLISFHNAYIVKIRSSDSSTAKGRTIGGQYFEPIAGYFCIPPEHIQVRRDNKGRIVQYRQYVSYNKYKSYQPNEIVHIYYNKRTGLNMGVPPLEAVKDDILALRRIEESIETLIYKSLFPILHVKVGTEKSPAKVFKDGTHEVDMVTKHLRSIEDNGGITTSERVEIKAIGAESLALRVSEYLSHFKSRVFIGLGMSSVDFGEGDCHSDDTEVLTENGWRYHHEVNHAAEKIATYNSSSGKIEFQIPTGKYEGFYSGQMVHVKNKHIDLLVTPNHDLYVKPREYRGKINDWRKEKAGNVLTNRSEFKFIENAEFEEANIQQEEIEFFSVRKKLGQAPRSLKCKIDDFSSFLGWFISEGCLHKKSGTNGHYRLSISQNQGPKLDEIIDIIKRCGFTYSIRKDKRDTNVNVVVYGRALFEHIESHIGHGSWNKNIPSYVFSWNRKQRLNVLNSLIDGDGHRSKDRRNSTCYYSVSKRLAGDVQRLAMSLGMYAKVTHCKQNENAHGSYIYVVNITKTDKAVKERTVTRDMMSSVAYSGNIFCYTVPNGLLITRRNGKTGIHGNSTGRATGEVLSESLKESVMDYQLVLSDFVTNKIFSELLVDGGIYKNEYLIPSEDKVTLAFNELDFNYKLKIESHLVNCATQKIISINEAREGMGRKALSDQEIKKTVNQLEIEQPPTASSSSGSSKLTKSIVSPKNQHSSLCSDLTIKSLEMEEMKFMDYSLGEIFKHLVSIASRDNFKDEKRIEMAAIEAHSKINYEVITDGTISSVLDYGYHLLEEMILDEQV